jgi:hypothetical protein
MESDSEEAGEDKQRYGGCQWQSTETSHDTTPFRFAVSRIQAGFSGSFANAQYQRSQGAMTMETLYP